MASIEQSDKNIQISPLSMLSRLDHLPFSKWHFFMVLSLGAVWIFDGYEVSLISIFRKYIVEQHNENVFKSLATAYQLGCIIGSMIFGISAYIIGRKKVFMITLSIYAIGILLSIIPHSVPLFIGGRFLTGISVGGQFTAIFTAIDEFLPSKYRGRVNIGIDGTWHLGGALAATLNLIIGYTYNWRLLFLIGLFGVLSLLMMRKSIPQSPRWLFLKGKNSDAIFIIDQIEQAVEQNNIFLQQISYDYQIADEGISDKKYQKSQQQKEYPINTSSLTSHQSNISNEERPNLIQYFTQIYGVLLQTFKKFKSRCFLAVFLIFSQAFFFNLVYYKFPAVLSQKYNLNQSEISLYMLPLSLSSFVSTLIIGPFFDIIGRKQLLLLTFGISGIMLYATTFIENLLWLEIVTCLMFCFTSPAASSANLIASEIFPTSSRTIVLFMMFITGMIGAIGGVWIDTIWVGSLLMLLAGIVGFILCPKSQNKSLQQIQRM